MRTSALTGHRELQRTLSFVRIDVTRAGQDVLDAGWGPGHGSTAVSQAKEAKWLRHNGSEEQRMEQQSCRRGNLIGPLGHRREGGANGNKFERSQSRLLPTAVRTPDKGFLLLIPLGPPEDCARKAILKSSQWTCWARELPATVKMSLLILCLIAVTTMPGKKNQCLF